MRVGDDPFGLLNQDTAVQRGLQLPPNHSALGNRSRVQNSDRGHVSKSARRERIIIWQRPNGPSPANSRCQ